MPLKRLVKRYVRRAGGVMCEPIRSEAATLHSVAQDGRSQVARLENQVARLADQVQRLEANVSDLTARLISHGETFASHPASLEQPPTDWSARFNALAAQVDRNSGRLAERLERQVLLLARLVGDGRASRDVANLHAAEFRAFSQFGDDGIIQHLVCTLRPEPRTFIEFGVEDYSESNTRFLLQHDSWRGLVLDGSEANARRIAASSFYWRHDLTAKAAFITAENVNELIGSAGFTGEVGLLHIDIDGNDYWVWKALNVVSPRIAIIEYNSVFGPDRAITVPYDPAFERFKAHHSGLYAGASLAALCDLAHEKGYRFIGSNSAGNNAYFLRADSLGPFTPLSAQEGYVESAFRGSRDETGKMTYVAGKARIELLRGLPIVNTRTGETETI